MAPKPRRRLGTEPGHFALVYPVSRLDQEQIMVAQGFLIEEQRLTYDPLPWRAGAEREVALCNHTESAKACNRGVNR